MLSLSELPNSIQSIFERIERMAKASGVVANKSETNIEGSEWRITYMYSSNSTRIELGWSVYAAGIRKGARLSDCPDAVLSAGAHLLFSETASMCVTYEASSKKWYMYCERLESDEPNPPDGITFATGVGATGTKQEIDEARAYEIIADMIACVKKQAS